MADNKGKNGIEDGSDFDFGDIESWEDESDSPSSDEKDSSDPFGEDAFSTEDDPFAPKASDESDPFGSSFGDGDDASDDVFDFQEMPSPDAMASGENLQGDPDSEFDDLDSFGGDDAGAFATEAVAESEDDDPFAGMDDEGLEDPFATDGGDDAVEVEDPFAEAPAETVEENDPFAPTAVEEAVQDPAPSTSGRKVPYVPIAIAASVVLAGYVGLNYVLPNFMGTEQPTVVANNPEPAGGPTFPTGLPNTQGGLQLPEAPSTVQPQLQPSQQQPLPQVNLPVPGQDAPTWPSDVAGGVQGSDGIGLQPQLPDLNATPLPNTLTPSTPVEEELAGPGRGGIDNYRNEPEESGTIRADLDDVDERLSIVEKKVDEIADRIDELVKRPVAQVVDAQPVPATSTPSEVKVEKVANLGSTPPPLKPEIVEDATLRGVSRGLAWVSTKSGVVEVKVGDTIPGAGRVNAIREYRGNWIVVTDSGLVME